MSTSDLRFFGPEPQISCFELKLQPLCFVARIERSAAWNRTAGERNEQSGPTSYLALRTSGASRALCQVRKCANAQSWLGGLTFIVGKHSYAAGTPRRRSKSKLRLLPSCQARGKRSRGSILKLHDPTGLQRNRWFRCTHRTLRGMEPHSRRTDRAPICVHDCFP